MITDPISTFVRAALLRTGRFYEHMDGSVVCKKCERTLAEGCTHAKVSVCR